MTKFHQLKNQIDLLGRAEYRYDRLTAEFAEHYLEITRAGYEPAPDLQILHSWLRHLNFEIRPSLVMCWKTVASHAGFELGDLIEVDGTKLYAVKANSYPDSDFVRFTGFGVKKDGAPSQTATSVNVTDSTTATTLGKSLEEAILAPLFFEGSSRLPGVRDFLKHELPKLA